MDIFCWVGHENMIGMGHDGFRNMYTFVKDIKSITLVPLTPKKVY